MSLKLFDYRCRKCDNHFEAFEEENSKCPKCESSELEKLITFAGYHINGSNGGSTRPRHSGAFKRKK